MDFLGDPGPFFQTDVFCILGSRIKHDAMKRERCGVIDHGEFFLFKSPR
jgi:hypothetical protein